MSQDRSIVVQVDDRVRLLAAALAMTNWPEQEQERQPHGVHAHAKATRKHLADFANHQAVRTMQELLDAGQTPETLLGFAACLNWPGLRARGDLPEWTPREWPAQLRDLYRAGRLTNFWEDEAVVWEQAISQAQKALAGADILDLQEQFFGPLNVKLVFHPNLCYPTDQEIGFRREDELYCVVPPRIAWGTNPPWPYDDDPAWAYAVTFSKYTELLLREYIQSHPTPFEFARSSQLPVPESFQQRHPDWFDQFAVIFVGGATAIFLERALGQSEAESFILMQHKAHGFTILPSAVSVLQRYLAEQQAGKFGEFADYVPAFRDSLRIAEKLSKM